MDTLVEALILLKEAEVPLQEKLVFAEEACRMEARQLLTSYAHIAKLTVLIGRLERSCSPVSEESRTMMPSSSRAKFIKKHKANLARLAARPDLESCSDLRSKVLSDIPRIIIPGEAPQPRGLSGRIRLLLNSDPSLATRTENYEAVKKALKDRRVLLSRKTYLSKLLERLCMTEQSLERKANFLRYSISSQLTSQSKRLQGDNGSVDWIHDYLVAMGLFRL